MKEFIFKKSFSKISLLFLMTLFSPLWLYAYSIDIDAPSSATHTSDPVYVKVYLDTEGEIVSGISGEISFPKNMFELHSVSTDGSVVAPWVTYPVLKKEEYLDGKAHISFEGIFAGGFSGVRSPYYNGARKGLLYTLILLPKEQGQGEIVIDSLSVYAFDEQATTKLLPSVIKTITVPDLISHATLPGKVVKQVSPKSVRVAIERSEFIHNNAWYVTVNDTEPKSAIESISVIEDGEVSVSPLDSRWREISSPHILYYQNRNKYVHVKIVYSNGAYALTTLPPVENFATTTTISRILIGSIIVIVLYVMYAYLIRHVVFFSKQFSKKKS